MIRMYKRPTPRKNTAQLDPQSTKPIDERITTDWSVWTMSPIAQAALPEPEDAESIKIEKEATRLREQEEILAQLKEQARQEAYAEGLAQGLIDGKKQGLDEGYREGYDAGMSCANEAQQRVAQELQQVLDTAQREMTDLREEIGQSLIAMGVRIASHILSIELANPGPSVASIVRKILAQQDDMQGTVTFYLHETDLALLRPLLQEHTHQGEVRLIPAEDLNRGDVKVRTAYGDIDATFQTRWDEAMAAIGLQIPAPTLDDPT